MGWYMAGVVNGLLVSPFAGAPETRIKPLNPDNLGHEGAAVEPDRQKGGEKGLALDADQRQREKHEKKLNQKRGPAHGADIDPADPITAGNPGQLKHGRQRADDKTKSGRSDRQLDGHDGTFGQPRQGVDDPSSLSDLSRGAR